MRIAILGAGNVGGALGKVFASKTAFPLCIATYYTFIMPIATNEL